MRFASHGEGQSTVDGFQVRAVGVGDRHGLGEMPVQVLSVAGIDC